MSERAQLSVIVHENDEVTVRDERSVALLCRDCWFSGWLTEWERGTNLYPYTCLHHSGGADVVDGDRIWTDDDSYWEHDRAVRKWRSTYPCCHRKNHDGA